MVLRIPPGPRGIRQARRRPLAGSPGLLVQGFTLVELGVVMAILVLASAASFPSIVAFYQEQRLRQAGIELQSLLLNARTLSQRQRGTCSVVRQIATPTLFTADASVSGNVCSRATLSNLDLAGLTGLRNLCVYTSLNNNCAATITVAFSPLGVLAGTPRTLFLSDTSNATSTQVCLDLSLALIRLGTRSGNSGSCAFLRS